MHIFNLSSVMLQTKWKEKRKKKNRSLNFVFFFLTTRAHEWKQYIEFNNSVSNVWSRVCIAIVKGSWTHCLNNKEEKKQWCNTYYVYEALFEVNFSTYEYYFHILTQCALHIYNIRIWNAFPAQFVFGLLCYMYVIILLSSIYLSFCLVIARFLKQ